MVIENDDHLYNLDDCLEIHDQIGIPIVFDILHHKCFPNKLSLSDTLDSIECTWNYTKDGNVMIDYSNQEPNQRKGKHSSTLNEEEFIEFAISINFLDADIMLEIKDKEKSAKRVIELLDHIKTR